MQQTEMQKTTELYEMIIKEEEKWVGCRNPPKGLIKKIVHVKGVLRYLLNASTKRTFTLLKKKWRKNMGEYKLTRDLVVNCFCIRKDLPSRTPHYLSSTYHAKNDRINFQKVYNANKLYTSLFYSKFY